MTVRPHKWTAEEFHAIGDSGVWEGMSILLIDGELIEMPAATPLHDMCLTLANYRLHRVFSEDYTVRIQMGLALNSTTDLVPDLAVVPGDPRTMTTTPTTAVFVLEVSETSFNFDTREKASLYAAAGIADYWVIDVVGKRVLVFRDPQPDPAAKYGHFYANIATIGPGQSLALLAAPHAVLDASNLLP